MKILLCDDELMVRLGLISMLDELYPGQHIYREAKNGYEMLHTAAEFLPDVAFVDIRMPHMDGLTALKECKKVSPYTQYLILTGYPNFEYARQSTRIGALDYLLKPVSLDDLQKEMETISNRLQNQRWKNNRIFSNYIIASYHKEQRNGKNEEQNMIPGIQKLFITLIIPEHASGKERRRQYEELYDTLLANFQGNNTGLYYALFPVSKDQLCLVSTAEPPDLYTLIPKKHECVTCIHARNIAIRNFPAYCHRLDLAVKTRMFCGCGQFIHWNTTLEGKMNQLVPFAIDVQNLCDAFSHCKELNYREVLQHMDTESYSGLYPLIGQDSLNRYLNLYLGCNIHTDRFSDLYSGLQACADQMYQSGKQNIQQNEIEWIKSYIQKNYMKDINIGSIARILGISSNYLSRLFHERVGCKFMDYLIQIRVTNAKRLFCQDPGITVSKVANLVGYLSVRHFSKIFARQVGCTPSEYQVRIAKDSP
jgi:two-component system response regulator YesN